MTFLKNIGFFRKILALNFAFLDIKYNNEYG